MKRTITNRVVGPTEVRGLKSKPWRSRDAYIIGKTTAVQKCAAVPAGNAWIEMYRAR